MMRLIIIIFLLALPIISYSQENDNDLNAIMETAVKLTSEGNYQEAMHLLEKGETIAKEDFKDDIEPWITCRNIMADIYMNTSDYADAESILLENKDALTSKKMEDAFIYRDLLAVLCKYYTIIHNYDKALSYIMECKENHERNLDFGNDYIICLSNCACVLQYFNQNLWAKLIIDHAFSLVQKSTDVPSTLIATVMSVLVNVYYYSSLKAEAKTKLNEALSFCESKGINTSFLNSELGEMYYKDHRFTDAYEYYKIALDTSIGYLQTSILQGLILSEYMSSKGAYKDDAVSFLNKMRDDVSKQFLYQSSDEREHYWEQNSKSFHNINGLLALNDSSTYDYVYDNILFSNSILIRKSQEIRDKVSAIGNEKIETLYNEIQELNERLSSIADSVGKTKIREDANKKEKALMKQLYSENKRQLFGSWEGIRSCLTKDDIAIEFELLINFNKELPDSLDWKLVAFTIRNSYEKPHMTILCDYKELIAMDKLKFYDTTDLYRKIWKPLEYEMSDIKNVYFSADWILHKIGIEYALNENNMRMCDERNYYRLSSTLEIVNAKETHGQSYVLFGGLSYDMDGKELFQVSSSIKSARTRSITSTEIKKLRQRSTFDDITSTTLEEVRDISKEIANHNVEPIVYTGRNGTEFSFKALSGKNIKNLHLATHGFYYSSTEYGNSPFFNENNIAGIYKYSSTEDIVLTRSGLLFAGAKFVLDGNTLPAGVEDGILTGREISYLDFSNLDLVVLSACDTGLGDIKDSEGVYGLQRAFKKAGAKSIMMSYWKVDDTATQLFMTEFYRHYLDGESKVAALKAAQQYLRNYEEDGERIYDSPKYWAAFVLLDAI